MYLEKLILQATDTVDLREFHKNNVFKISTSNNPQSEMSQSRRCPRGQGPAHVMAPRCMIK